ncbi:MAG: family 16 glycosylhydrolase [Clostridia bacterium]|nr:family 16 glycosylhydrolase [Clostridia bacterium]
MKKLIAYLLAVIMVLSLAIVGVLADDNQEETDDNTIVTSSETQDDNQEETSESQNTSEVTSETQEDSQEETSESENNTVTTAISTDATVSTTTSQKEENDTVREINGYSYVRTFYDEFEGEELDSTKWEKCPEWSRQSGYSKWDDNLTTLDGEGHLILSADYVEGEKALHCGAIRTRTKDGGCDLFNQKYGYFEISAKLQSKPGFWSAFWLMPDEIDRGIEGGSDGTEIDIFEAFDPVNQKINNAIHWDGYGSKHKKIDNQVKKDVYDGKYHTFALDWSEDAYKFYIDGKRTLSITAHDVDIAEYANYLKISLESGSWTGKPDDEDMPDGISVDYVKVYQREEYLNPKTTKITTTTATTAKETTKKTTVTTTTKKAVKKLTLSKPAIKVKAGKKKFTVSWKKVKNAKKYKVYYKLKSAKKWKTVTLKGTKKTIKKLKKGKKYSVKVIAINGKVKSKFSKVKTVKVK